LGITPHPSSGNERTSGEKGENLKSNRVNLSIGAMVSLGGQYRTGSARLLGLWPQEKLIELKGAVLNAQRPSFRA
jgi:hypothetical protein